MSSDDDESTTEYTDNKYVDELTMKLLSNKTNYAKYLAMTDERKHEEQQQFIKDCIEYKSNILAMTRKMCNGEENEYGSDVSDSFEIYARTLIRYLEVKQSSDEAQKEYEELNDTTDDNDIIPSVIDNMHTKPKCKKNQKKSSKKNPFTLEHFRRK